MEFVELDLGTSLAPYEATWQLQRETLDAVAAGQRPDTVLLVEHEPVYTAGKRTASWERPTDGTPVVDVDRGGRITWHGPGQLVGYPIVRLAEPVDVVAYVRAIERALIDTCAELGLDAVRTEGRSGVWLPADDARRERKLAAIGVRVSRGVTMHGFALNCDVDLAVYAPIVPCGIEDADTTSLSVELGRVVRVIDVAPLVREHLERALAPMRAATRNPAPSSGPGLEPSSAPGLAVG